MDTEARYFGRKLTESFFCVKQEDNHKTSHEFWFSDGHVMLEKKEAIFFSEIVLFLKTLAVAAFYLLDVVQFWKQK